MGGDTSPILLYQGVMEASYTLEGSCTFTVLGFNSLLEEINQEPSLKLPKSIVFKSVSEEVLMSDDPLIAVRRKQNSSMGIGFKMLKQKKCDAFVSSGNTGAMTAFSNIELDKLPLVERAALLTTLPTKTGPAAILDVGANITFRPHHFFQFALMGAAYQKAILDLKEVEIGLLNIGEEASKGTKKLRIAHDFFKKEIKKLEGHNLIFKGNVESRDLFHGKVDVLVTDGFTGNVFLKTCEGVSSFIIDQIQKSFVLDSPKGFDETLVKLEKYLNYAEYPGAVMLGVDGVVIKCHGHSCTKAMFNGVMGAYRLVEKSIITKMKIELLAYSETYN